MSRRELMRVPPDAPTFRDAVELCFSTPEFMEQYRRLTGSTLGPDDRSPIARMIDEATGFDLYQGEWEPFFRFVREFVWQPLLYQACIEGMEDRV